MACTRRRPAGRQERGSGLVACAGRTVHSNSVRLLIQAADVQAANPLFWGQGGTPHLGRHPVDRSPQHLSTPTRHLWQALFHKRSRHAPPAAAPWPLPGQLRLRRSLPAVHVQRQARGCGGMVVQGLAEAALLLPPIGTGAAHRQAPQVPGRQPFRAHLGSATAGCRVGLLAAGPQCRALSKLPLWCWHRLGVCSCSEGCQGASGGTAGKCRSACV